MPNVGGCVDRYEIEGVIGEGGMGRVYRALDPRLGRRVALKVLLANGSEQTRHEAAARMLREARAAAAFNHPNVVAIYDVGEVDGSPYIAMELISGSTLRDAAGKDGVLATKKVSWLTDVARGLAAAHRSGLVHRDIKPDNVMVTTDETVKILDFGIARHADVTSPDVDMHAPTAAARAASITAEGLMLGTPHYMAPEQLRAEPLDGRCDQFAWGVMAWELLAGRSPWGTPTNPTVLIASVLSVGAQPLRDVVPEVGSDLSDIVARALSKDRDARFPTMDALLAALERASLAVSITPRPSEDALSPTVAAPIVASTPRAAHPPVDAELSSRAQSRGEARSPELDRPRRKRGGLFAAIGIIAVLAGTEVFVRIRASGPDAPPPQLAATSNLGTAAHAGPEDNLFPCKETHRTLIPPREGDACVDNLIAWCATDGTQVGCCADGMIARTREGTCECPPGGVPANSPASKCPRAEAADGASRLPAEVIQRVVRKSFDKFEACRQAARKRVPDESGRAKAYFEINPNGRVFFARLQDTTLTDPDAQACVLAEVRRLQFPPPVGGVVTVVYPILFDPEK